MGVGGQRHAPAALPLRKTRYPLYREARWAPGPVWTGAENLAPTGIRSPNRPARSELLAAQRASILVYYNQQLAHYQDRPQTCRRPGHAPLRLHPSKFSA